MATERTLAILKPDCVRKQLIGEVLHRFEAAGFKICALRMQQLTRKKAEGFYDIHRELPFFNDLLDFMTSGPCVPVVLEKDNAVKDFRIVIGATDPAEAADGTIRKDFGDNKGENIVHGSDSSENARKEIAFFFAANGAVSD